MCKERVRERTKNAHVDLGARNGAKQILGSVKSSGPASHHADIERLGI